MRYRPLPNGTPRKDVFRRVLSALKRELLQKCFANWISGVHERARLESGEMRPIYPIDGKTLRRSHDHKKGLKPLHSMTVWASDHGLTLAQVETVEKSHEITVIPEILKLVNREGAVITIDAMGTRTEIAAQIVEGNAVYCLALKGTSETYIARSLIS